MVTHQSLKPDPDIVQNEMLFPDVPDVEPESIGGIVDPCGNGNGGADFGPRSPACFKAVEEELEKVAGSHPDRLQRIQIRSLSLSDTER